MSVAERNGAGAASLATLGALPAALSSAWFGAALVAVAIGQQLAGHLDCDVSWFITFAEKFVDGRVPYVEVSDPNPPAAFLVFVPAVLIARALQVATEAVVAAMVFVGAAASIAFAFYVLRHGAARSRRAWRLLLNAAIYLLLVAPEIVFAEREHLALLAVIPMLATLAVDERSRRLPRAARVVAGLGAGVAMAFKPYFALAVAMPALATAWRERSLRGLWRAEMWTAAFVAFAYMAAIFAFFPAYWEQALPLIVDVYARAHDDWGNIASHTLAPFYAALFAGFLAAARGLVLGRATRVALFASLGFFVSFLVQGKGWINHAYPAVAFILFAWTFLALGDRAARTARSTGAKERLIKFLFVPALVAAPAFFGIFEQVSDREEHPGLLDAVARVAPPHPRIAAMASGLDFGHPLVRQLGGEWVGRQNALWVTALVGRLLPSAASPAYRERLEAYRRDDLEAFAQDVRALPPDVVIVEDAATREFVLKRAETAGVLESYRLAKRAGEIEIWRREADRGGWNLP